jgi:predicted Rossmann-fold nucleotide-binding protein/DNA-binding transcriptional regulator YhcF (GntR family)
MPNALQVARIEPGADAAPLYRQAKRALLESIEAGRCAPGSALPSETTLAAALGISIGTLRHAVDELVAERILMRRQGRGTFVATHTTDRFVFQFFHVERADGHREAPQVELLAFERARLDDEAAAALGRPAGDPAILVENRLSLQGRPVVATAGPESSYRLAFADERIPAARGTAPGAHAAGAAQARAAAAGSGHRGHHGDLRQRAHPSRPRRAPRWRRRSAGGDADAERRARKQLVFMRRYYEEARRLAELVTRERRSCGTPIYVVTGGGPGIMEAGNRGAYETGGQEHRAEHRAAARAAPNAYITPELCFQFHYFALRKMHFLMRSSRWCAFPAASARWTSCSRTCA